MDILNDNTAIYYLAGAVILIAFACKNAYDYHVSRKNYWPPQSDFQTPAPLPLPNFDVNATPPLKYRPFRHGPNHITMGIRFLDWNSWIEMDSNFLPYHSAKVSELAKGREKHIAFVDNPQTRRACFEVYEELVLFLTRRYPNIFRKERRKKSDGGKGSREVVTNALTGEAFSWPAESPEVALEYAGLLIQDDIMLMVKNPDGNYRLDAACVCLPGFWRLHEKFRTSLDELHQEAKVPHYDSKLKLSMNRHFERLVPEKAVVRNNYFIQLDGGLFWSHRMGDQEGTEVASWEKADASNLSVDDLHFRSERQTLRRLPQSGALMFTVRTYFEPVTRIAEEPHVPGRLAEAIREWTPEMKIYKGGIHWEKMLLQFLDGKHREQVKSGTLEQVPEGEYPF